MSPSAIAEASQVYMLLPSANIYSKILSQFFEDAEWILKVGLSQKPVHLDGFQLMLKYFRDRV